MVDREDLRRQLIDVGLARISDKIVQSARRCNRIRTTPSDDQTIPLGTSKFGGSPDLPLDFSWPEWNQQPLLFLGQINLATIGKTTVSAALPSNGLLSFFYDRDQSTWGFDPKDRGSWAVYLFRNDSLHRTPPPDSTSQSAEFAPCELSFDEILTIPSSESLSVQALNLTDEERDMYWELDSDDESDYVGHQLLGHPKEIQSEMQLECQLASNGVYCGDSEGYQNPLVAELEGEASQWMLLFQCDSDDNVGWMWGDVGCLYFWVTESDLKVQRFDRVWMILQCS